MKINIYYGGRGLIEDPTIAVCDKITTVLDELRVDVHRYNLYEERNGIPGLSKTIKEADGIILATTVEWFGIGGFMSEFLDSVWLYGDKEKLNGLYMMPVVTATTYGEKEAEYDLKRAWELLGGRVCDGVCAYVADHLEFELNAGYGKQIEKIAENLYRSINQKIVRFPSSEAQLRTGLTSGVAIPLTPQESEQLSKYVSDENTSRNRRKISKNCRECSGRCLEKKPMMRNTSELSGRIFILWMALMPATPLRYLIPVRTLS